MLTKVQSEMAGAGQVLQVVQGTYSTPQTSTTSTPFSRVNVSITPKSATSKILLRFSQSDVASNNGQASVAFYRDGSSIFKFATETTRQYLSNVFIWFSISGDYLDSPATTSAITYSVYVWNPSNTGSVIYGDNSMPAVLTATEIAG